METSENLLRVYRDLADWYERQHQPQMRDRFLVLAADAALAAGRPDEAEHLRLRLLKVNPHHMLKPYASFAEALKASDVLTYVKDLRTNYPADVAEDLLRTLQGDEAQRPTGLPATAPLVDIGGPLGEPPGPADEGETFFPLKPEEDRPRTAAPGPPNAPRPRAPGPAGPLPQTIPLQGPNPPRRPPVAPTRPLPAQPAPARRPVPPPPDARPAAPRPTDEPAAGGAWFAALLFILVVAAGLALAGFVLLRPYLPPGWLP